MASFLYFISWEIIFITEILIIIKWLLMLQILLIYIVFSQIIIHLYDYLAILTIFLNYYIMLVDTTLNGGTKSGTEVSSFNTYLVCVSFFMPVDRFKFRLCFTWNINLSTMYFLLIIKKNFNMLIMFHVKH